MMLDAAGKVWLLEVNNSPGLEYCDSHETGVCPDAGWNDDVTKQICHDRFALLGMDRDVCAKGDANNFVRVCWCWQVATFSSSTSSKFLHHPHATTNLTQLLLKLRYS